MTLWTCKHYRPLVSQFDLLHHICFQIDFECRFVGLPLWPLTKKCIICKSRIICGEKQTIKSTTLYNKFLTWVKLLISARSAFEYGASLGGGCKQLLHSCLKSKATTIFLYKKNMCIIIDVLYAIDICMSTLIRFCSLLEIFFYSFITIELVINEHSNTKSQSTYLRYMFLRNKHYSLVKYKTCHNLIIFQFRFIS